MTPSDFPPCEGCPYDEECSPERFAECLLAAFRERQKQEQLAIALAFGMPPDEA